MTNVLVGFTCGFLLFSRRHTFLSLAVQIPINGGGEVTSNNNNNGNELVCVNLFSSNSY